MPATETALSPGHMPGGVPESGGPALVELVGLPGAGKSTVSRHVASLLSAAGFPVDQATAPLAHSRGTLARHRRKLGLVLRLLAAEPARAWTLTHVVRRSGQHSLHETARLAFNACLVAAALDGVRAPVALCDQGPCQVAWSVLLTARQAGPDEVLGGLLPAVGGGHVVIILRVTAPTAARRLARRPGRQSRLERRAGHPLFTAEQGARVLDALVEALARRRRGPQIIVLDNDADGREEALARAIVRHLRGVDALHVIWQGAPATARLGGLP